MPSNGLVMVVVGGGAWLVAANLAAVVVFYWDKRAARRGTWRVSEKALCRFSLVGGHWGARWAMERLRHKTRKESFQRLQRWHFAGFWAWAVLVSAALIGLHIRDVWPLLR